jgi:hypothetical protein
MVRTSMALASAFAVMLLIGSAAPGVQAQQQQPATPPVASFPQEKIEAFADAAVELQRVQDEFNAQLQAAEDEAAIGQLQEQAQQEATQAIEDKGVSTDEYGAIAQAANQDPALYAMIVDLMRQRSTE